MTKRDLSDPRTFHVEMTGVDADDEPAWSVVDDNHDPIELGVGYPTRRMALDRLEEMIEEDDAAEIEYYSDEYPVLNNGS